MANLTSRLILTLIDHVTGPARNVQHAITQVHDRIERNNRALSAARGDLFGATAAATAFALALASPVRAAAEFESAMADVRKVVDFPTPESYQEFRDQLFRLSREIPITVTGLTEIAAAAGQAGIAGADLIRFTEAAAKIGTAFDISADEAGDALAKMMTGLNLSIEEVVSLSDAMNHLSNVQASGADEILDVVRRVGAQGKQFGFTAEQTAAFASAMISAGAQSDVAATSFANMGRALTRGASATLRQRGAYRDLGLEATDVARRMQEDAIGTTLDVMERIAALPAEMRAAVSSDLFGDEARALGPLLTNLDLARESLNLVADEASYAGSAYREFENRNRTFNSQLRRFLNVLQQLSITVGEALLPALTDLMTRVTPIIEAMIAWASENGDLVRTVTQVVGALLGLRVALLALKVVGLTGRGGYLWLLANGLSTVGGAASRLGTATRQAFALQAALAAMSGVQMTKLDAVRAGLRGIAGITGLSATASAISAVVAAMATISAPVWATIAAVVAAIAAAGFAVWKFWDRLSAIFRGVAAAIWEALQPALEALRPIVEAIEPYVRPVIEVFRRLGEGIASVGTRITGAFNAVTRFFSGDLFAREILTEDEKARIAQSANDLVTRIIAAFAALPGQLYQAGVQAIQGLWDGMVEKFEEMMEFVRTIPSRISEAVGNISLGFSSPDVVDAVREHSNAQRAAVGMPPLPAPDARAAGGNIWPGRAYRVGERGEEMIFPTRAGYVVAAEQTRRLLAMTRQISAPIPAGLGSGSVSGRGGPGLPSSVTFGDIIIQGGPQASAEELSREFGRQVGVALRSHYSDAI